MTVHLVRHARAGSRKRWTGDDALRPLSKAGRAQADGIARRLAAMSIDRVLSSPAIRCVGTVAPLAQRLGVEVATTVALAEGARLSQTLQLLEEVQGLEAVLCTHGDVVEQLLDHLGSDDGKPRSRRMEKGSVWELDLDGNQLRHAHYVAPPTG